MAAMLASMTVILAAAFHAPAALTVRGRAPLCVHMQSDEEVREALRLPEPGAPELRDEEPPTPTTSNQPDLLIPFLSIGSFAGFGLLIANEYLTRGFCPPFLNTCFSLNNDAGGWGS